MAEIYEMTGHLIRRLNQISVSVFAEQMARIGVEITPVQFSALCVLAQTPGIDQATLAGAIAYDRTTMGGVIDRLEARGLVRREVSRRDRRARELHLSEKGREVLAVVRPVVRALQQSILAGLDAQEQREMIRLLKKTTEAGNALSRAPLVVKE